MRKFPLLLAALLIAAVLIPAQAQAFKPQIVYVRASEDTGGVQFSVKVRMDQGGRNKREVFVNYKGDRKEAHPLDTPPLSHYETRAYSIPVRNCYRGVEITARNRFGTTKRTMRAGMLGTNGCG